MVCSSTRSAMCKCWLRLEQTDTDGVVYSVYVVDCIGKSVSKSQ